MYIMLDVFNFALFSNNIFVSYAVFLFDSFISGYIPLVDGVGLNYSAGILQMSKMVLKTRSGVLFLTGEVTEKNSLYMLAH